MNVLTKTLNLQEAHTGKTNGRHSKAVENIYRVIQIETEEVQTGGYSQLPF